jgi:hypothetical protein
MKHYYGPDYNNLSLERESCLGEMDDRGVKQVREIARMINFDIFLNI